MKKVFTIIIALVYFAVSSGIIVNMHYCMGKFSGVSYHASDDNHCGKCGMTDNGCCHNTIKVVKMVEAQNFVSPVNYQIPALTSIVPKAYTFNWVLPPGYKDVRAFDHSPPRGVSPSLSVLHCVFLI